MTITVSFGYVGGWSFSTSILYHRLIPKRRWGSDRSHQPVNDPSTWLGSFWLGKFCLSVGRYAPRHPVQQ